MKNQLNLISREYPHYQLRKIKNNLFLQIDIINRVYESYKMRSSACKY